MLVARGERLIGGATFRWAMVFLAGGYLQIIEADGIVCDTRVFPAPDAPPKPLVCLELVVRGTYHAFGALEGTFGERTAFALGHEHYQGANGERSFAFRAEGPRLVIVEWHAPSEILVPAGRLPRVIEALADEVWSSATRAGALSERDDASLEAEARTLVEALAAHGVVTEAGAAKALRPPAVPLARLWRALKPTIEHLALSVTAADLGAAVDMSPSQVERAFRRWATAFALVGPGLRSVTRMLRLNTAVLFLSAADASVDDVARATGYGSADAMARAFRDSGLAAPSAVQKMVRGVDRPGT